MIHFNGRRSFTSPRQNIDLFGGAAGPGKTKALLWEAIFQANEVAGSDTLLLRRTYPELESSLLAYFRRDVPREVLQELQRIKASGDLAERFDDAVRVLPQRE